MRDRNKIIVGLIIFVILVTFPFWRQLAASGEADVARPDLDYPDPAEVPSCVEDSAYMTANHPHLLNDWRDQLVREGVTEYTSSTGEVYQISLTHTCLDCHEDRDAFCNRCHDYSNVDPTCWDCHTTPGGGS